MAAQSRPASETNSNRSYKEEKKCFIRSCLLRVHVVSFWKQQIHWLMCCVNTHKKKITAKYCQQRGGFCNNYMEYYTPPFLLNNAVISFYSDFFSNLRNRSGSFLPFCHLVWKQIVIFFLRHRILKYIVTGQSCYLILGTGKHYYYFFCNKKKIYIYFFIRFLIWKLYVILACQTKRVRIWDLVWSGTH